MSDEAKRERFESQVLIHMDAAYRLAAWLMRSESQAEEAVQEAYLRAFRFFESFRGGDARPWLLGIVRNTCYTLIEQEGPAAGLVEFHEETHGEEAMAAGAVLNFPLNPESAAIADAEAALVQRCLRALPAEYREVVVLRELQECSYKDIAAIAGVPIGTVMSRLARGRRLLRRALVEQFRREDTGT